MDLNTIKDILILVAPSFSASTTIFGCMIFLLKKLKKNSKENDQKLIDSQNKLKKAYDDIAKIKAKTESIENAIIEIKEKR